MQDNKLLPFNTINYNDSSSSDVSSLNNMDLLYHDNIFTDFITKRNSQKSEFDYFSRNQAPSLNSFDLMQLDEFFIIDKMPLTINELEYHSSKDIMQDTQQDILAAYIYSHYSDDYHFFMTPNNRIQIKDDYDTPSKLNMNKNKVLKTSIYKLYTS